MYLLFNRKGERIGREHMFSHAQKTADAHKEKTNEAVDIYQITLVGTTENIEKIFEHYEAELESMIKEGA